MANETEGPLSNWRLAMSLLVALSGLVLSYHLKLGIEKKLSIALARAVVQLLLLGFVLLNFLFSMNSLPLVAGYLVAMLLIAATEVINRQVRSYDGHYIDALISCTVSGGFCGIYASVVVFNPTPWWNPRVFLPSSGMIIGNSVSGPSVAVDRLLSEVTEKKHETEVRLAFGATGFEALLPTVRAATLAALMPNLNMLSIVGVVSIPGMMTGQLLGGSTPIVAAEYQMAILFLITTTTVLSTYLAVMLAIKHAVLSPEQRLTSERILKVTGPKRSIDAALIDGMYFAATTVLNILSQRCCCLAYCAPLWTPAAETGTRASSGTGTHSAAAYSALPQSALLELPAMARSGGINPLQGTTTMVRERDEASGLEGTELDIESGRLHRATYSVRINAEVLPHGTPLLEIQHLNIKSGELLLFDQEGFTLTLHAGERIALEGISGLGKTRLLRAMALLDDCENGVLTIYSGQRDMVHGHNGSSVAVRGKGDRAQGQVEHAPLVYAHWRSRVLYIPQALPPLAGTPVEFLTEVAEFVARKETHWEKEQLVAACEDLEKRVLLDAGKMSQSWSSLSGGERQRAIIACGVILSLQENDASVSAAHFGGAGGVLLLDEPTAACDETASLAVEKVLMESGLACVMVTHDPRQAARFAHRRVTIT